MRTKKTIRVSFSADRRSLNVKLPTAWPELSQRELADVYALKAAFAGSGRLRFELFRYFSGCRVVRRSGADFICAFAAMHTDGRVRKVRVPVSPEVLAELLTALDFIDVPGDVPVRLECWGRARAVDAELHGVNFGTYVQIENLYQGFLQSREPEALRSLAVLLYPGIRLKELPGAFVHNILQWMVQLKALFSQMWPHFFKPATGKETASSMLEVMNAEVRALTGGDISKEEVVFASDCWRALTELDFKAKEAEEMRRSLSK